MSIWQMRNYRLSMIIVLAVAPIWSLQTLASSLYPPPPGAYRPIDDTNTPAAAAQTPAYAPAEPVTQHAYPAPSVLSPVPEVDPAFAQHPTNPNTPLYQTMPNQQPGNPAYQRYPTYQAPYYQAYEQTGYPQNNGPSFSFSPDSVSDMMPPFFRNQQNGQQAPAYEGYAPPPSYDYYPPGNTHQPAYQEPGYPAYAYPANQQDYYGQGYSQPYQQPQDYGQYPEYAPSSRETMRPAQNEPYTQAYPQDSQAPSYYGSSGYIQGPGSVYQQQNHDSGYPTGGSFMPVPGSQNPLPAGSNRFRPPELQGTD